MFWKDVGSAPSSVWCSVANSKVFLTVRLSMANRNAKMFFLRVKRDANGELVPELVDEPEFARKWQEGVDSGVNRHCDLLVFALQFDRWGPIGFVVSADEWAKPRPVFPELIVIENRKRRSRFAERTGEFLPLALCLMAYEVLLREAQNCDG